MTRPRVVVVGAGFGGLWAARTLAREAKLINWAWNYVFSKRAVRLVLPYGKSEEL